MSLIERVAQAVVQSDVEPAEVIERLDLVSAYVKNGQIMLHFVSGGRRIDAKVRPLILGSLIAGLGQAAATLIQAR